MGEFLAALFVVGRLVVNFQESLESNHFTVGNELQIGLVLAVFRFKGNVYGRFFYLRIRHL